MCPGGLSAPHAESGYWFTEAAPLNFFKYALSSIYFSKVIFNSGAWMYMHAPEGQQTSALQITMGGCAPTVPMGILSVTTAATVSLLCSVH